MMSSLAEAFKHPKDGLHTIRIDDVPYVLYLEADVADFVNSQLLSPDCRPCRGCGEDRMRTPPATTLPPPFRGQFHNTTR